MCAREIRNVNARDRSIESATSRERRPRRSRRARSRARPPSASRRVDAHTDRRRDATAIRDDRDDAIARTRRRTVRARDRDSTRRALRDARDATRATTRREDARRRRRDASNRDRDGLDVRSQPLIDSIRRERTRVSAVFARRRARASDGADRGTRARRTGGRIGGEPGPETREGRRRGRERRRDGVASRSARRASED